MTDIAMVRMLEERDAEIKRLTTERNILHGEADMLRTDNERLQSELTLWQTVAEQEVALWHNEVDRLARGWATPAD